MSIYGAEAIDAGTQTEDIEDDTHDVTKDKKELAGAERLLEIVHTTLHELKEKSANISNKDTALKHCICCTKQISRQKEIEEDVVEEDERQHQIKRSIPEDDVTFKDIIGSRCTKSTEEEVIVYTDEENVLFPGIHVIKGSLEEDEDSNYFNDRNLSESVIERISTDQIQMKKIENVFTVKSPNQEYVRHENLEEMASDECSTDVLLSERTIFDKNEVVDSEMATEPREEDYIREENSFFTNSNSEHLLQNNDRNMLTVEVIPGSSTQDIICKIEPKEFKKNNSNDKDGEVDGYCTSETFYETTECNCNHEIFYETSENVPVISECFLDINSERIEPDDDYEYFSASDGETETDLEDIESVLSSSVDKIAKKNKHLTASRIYKDVYHEVKLCNSWDEALTYAKFPKNCESLEVISWENEASEEFIISQPEGKHTEDETVRLANIEFRKEVTKEMVQQSHHIKEESREVTIQDSCNMYIIQEISSCSPLQMVNQCSKWSRNSNNYPELQLDIFSETTIDCPLSLNLVKTSQNGINKTKGRKSQKSISNQAVELVTHEQLYETTTTEIHNAELCLDERKLRYIFCTNLSEGSDNSLDRKVKALTNSSTEVENPHNNLARKTCKQLIDSTNTHPQPRYATGYSVFAIYHMGLDFDDERSSFIDYLSSTLTLSRQERPQDVHIVPINVTNQTPGNSCEGNTTFETLMIVLQKCIKDSSKAESSNGIKMYSKSSNYFDMSKKRTYQYRSDLYKGVLNKTSLHNEDNEVKEYHIDDVVDAKTYAVKEMRKLAFKGDTVHFQRQECIDINKMQNMSSVDDILLTLLKELENNRISEVIILQCQSNEKDIRSNIACIERTVNEVYCTSDFELQIFQAPLLISWMVDIIRTVDGIVFSKISFWIQFRITFLLALEEFVDERKKVLDRKNTCKESKIVSWKNPPEHHLQMQDLDSGNRLIEPVEESPSIPGTSENSQRMPDLFCVKSYIDIKKDLITRRKPDQMGSLKRQSVNKQFGAWHTGTFSNQNPNSRLQLKIKSKPNLRLDLKRQDFGHSINIACADIAQTCVQVGDDNSIFQTGVSNGIDGEISKESSSPYWFGMRHEMKGNYQHTFDQVHRDFKSEPPGTTILDELNLKHPMKTGFQMLYLLRDPGNRVLVYILYIELCAKGFLVTEWAEKKSSIYRKVSASFFCDGGTIYLDLQGNNSKNMSEMLIQVGTDNFIGLNQGEMTNLKEKTWFIPWESPVGYHSKRHFSSWMDESSSLDQLSAISLAGSSERQRRNRQYMTCEIKLSVFLKQSLFEIAVQKAANRCTCSCRPDKYSHLFAQCPYTTVDNSTSARQTTLNIDVLKNNQKMERLPNEYECTDTGNFFKQTNVQNAMNSESKGLSGLSSYCKTCQNVCTFSAQIASCVGCSTTQDAQSARDSSNHRSFESRTSTIYLNLLGRAAKLIVETLRGSDSFDNILDFLGLQEHHVSESGIFVFSSDNIADVVDKLNDTEQYIHELLFVILQGLDLADDILINSKDSFTPEFTI